MGMTIEEAINRVQPYAHPYCLCLQITGEEAHQVSQAIMVLANTSQKYQMLQADYENHLKADMVAMFTEIQLEIKELWDSRYDVWLDNQYYIGKSDTLEEVDEVIQQKIDALKEVVEDGKENK